MYSSQYTNKNVTMFESERVRPQGIEPRGWGPHNTQLWRLTESLSKSVRRGRSMDQTHSMKRSTYCQDDSLLQKAREIFRDVFINSKIVCCFYPSQKWVTDFYEDSHLQD